MGHVRLPSIFIPICLYAKTAYKRKENMQYIFSKYIQQSKTSLILICDDLHAYNLIIMNRCSSIDEAFKKAKSQCENLQAMISNIHKRFNNKDNVRIAKWNDLTRENKYIRLFDGLRRFVKQDKKLREIVDEFVALHVQKFLWRIDQEALKWEERYLLEEIAMSIYVTEILGYPRELWETPPNPKFPDPIGYLYETRTDLIQMLVGNTTLNRKLEILEISKKYCLHNGG